MSLYLTKPISIAVGETDDETRIAAKLARLLHVDKADLQGFTLRKRSVDARNKKDVRFVCSYVVDCKRPPQNAASYQAPRDVFADAVPVRRPLSCIVVGAGPAGLFSALYLSKCGVSVTVLERGDDVDSRKTAVDNFFAGGTFLPESNVQFGLGGAGTFSDGKLTSGLAGTSLGQSVFNKFVDCGAPSSILYDALPHIGTDNLRRVVANLRDEITACGGKFLFRAKAEDFIVEGGAVKGAVVNQNGVFSRIYADCTVLACGHSARDTFQTLYNLGADMRFKPFAVGLRVEHPREFIDVAQYGKLFAAHRDLGSANYKLTYRCADGRGCYSFCMCPGGVVVAANSEEETVVVNGMSDYLRNGPNSNSALVVTVDERDVERYGFGRDVFSGIRFQRDLERNAYLLGGGGYAAPCQNVTDFLKNRVSTELAVSTSYPLGVKMRNLRELLPKDMGDNLAEALTAFNRKIRGFGESGVLTGVETRTSSPVKILRGDNFQSNLAGLYPTGEGAGYAGGIVSSAVDGLRVALTITDGL